MESKIYKYIVDYNIEHKAMPELQEIADNCGLKSKRMAWYYVNKLVEAKIIKKDNKGRIRFTEEVV